MPRLNLHLIWLSLIFLFGCSDNPVSTGQTGVIWPLKAGNYWKYRWLTYDTTGTLRDTTLFTDSVLYEMRRNNETWYSIQTPDILIYSDGVYYANKSDGLYLSADSGTTSQRIYKYPVGINEYIVKGSDTTRIVALQQLVQTEAGKFYCIVYQKRYFQNSTWTYLNEYLSPGNGLIKVEISATKDGHSYTTFYLIELITFKLY